MDQPSTSLRQQQAFEADMCLVKTLPKGYGQFRHEVTAERLSMIDVCLHTSDVWFEG